MNHRSARILTLVVPEYEPEPCDCVMCRPADHLRWVQEAVAANLAEETGWQEEQAIILAANPHDPAGAVLIAEAANFAAKITGDYTPKTKAFIAAAMTPGVESAWGEDGCFYLEAPGAGQCCAHDPFGELELALTEVGWRPTKTEAPKWSGVHRQAWAFAALANPQIRRLLDAATTGRWRPGCLSIDELIASLWRKHLLGMRVSRY